ncbi:hypothetical protein VTN77DRAFT_1903 [Rasamsonia byssochlamydoides]|uniref:uncharacterized protein n=1 Tax=Rasamsonia byssochlamydoides TaxID=89139 RepID=UPI0037435883
MAEFSLMLTPWFHTEYIRESLGLELVRSAGDESGYPCYDVSNPLIHTDDHILDSIRNINGGDGVVIWLYETWKKNEKGILMFFFGSLRKAMIKVDQTVVEESWNAGLQNMGSCTPLIYSLMASRDNRGRLAIRQ